MEDDLLLRCSRLVIRTSMQAEIVHKLYWDTLALLNVEREHDQQFGSRELRHNYRIRLNDVLYAANNARYRSNLCCQLFYLVDRGKHWALICSSGEGSLFY